MKPDRHADSRERILFFLKTKGPQTTAALADRLDLTAMAVRQHLGKLAEADLVDHIDEPRPVGRPAQVWRLTEAGHGRFPEGSGELLVDLIGQVRSAFGDDGLSRLLAGRNAELLQRYRQQLPAAEAPLAKRVAGLCKLRQAEGYMAEWSRGKGGVFTLIENHCPICVAATACTGLCDQELELFSAALGDDASVERTEHLLDGKRRCVYRITSKN